MYERLCSLWTFALGGSIRIFQVQIRRDIIGRKDTRATEFEGFEAEGCRTDNRGNDCCPRSSRRIQLLVRGEKGPLPFTSRLEAPDSRAGDGIRYQFRYLTIDRHGLCRRRDVTHAIAHNPLRCARFEDEAVAPQICLSRFWVISLSVTGRPAWSFGPER